MSGIEAGSLYFSLGVKEADLAALERKIAELGGRLSDYLNRPKQPSGSFKGLIKELDELQAKFKAGKINQTDFDKGLDALKNKATPVTSELKKLSNEVRGLRNEYQATGANSKEVVADLRRVRDEALRLANTVERGSDEWARYRVIARQAQATIDGIQGRMSRLGLASQVQLGVQQQLTSSLRSIGPAGTLAATGLDTLGFAGGAASVGALALGGALTGVAVGAASLTNRGVPLVKEFQSALNTLEANGVEDLDAVTDAIRRVQEESGRAGRQFNRAEIATAVAETVKANRSEAESLELLKGSLQLAAAEGDNLNDSTLNLSANMRVFGISTDQAQLVASKFVVAGNLAQKEAKDFSVGLNAVGNSAKIAGFDLDETLGILVALDNNGLNPAEEGARAFRAIIAGLADPSQKAQGILSSLNIELTDSAGNTRLTKDVFFDLVAALNKTEQQGGSAKDVLNGLVQELNNNAEAGATAFGLFDTLGANAVLGLGDNVSELTDKIAASGDEIADYTDTKLKGLEPAQVAASKALDDLATTFSSFVAPAIETSANFLATFIRQLDSLANRKVTVSPFGGIVPPTFAEAGSVNAALDAFIQGSIDQAMKNGFKDLPQPDTGDWGWLYELTQTGVPSDLGFKFEFAVSGADTATTTITEAATTLNSLNEQLDALKEQRGDTAVGTPEFDSVNASIDALEKQIKAYEGVRTTSRRTTTATLTDEQKRQKSIRETQAAYQDGLQQINTEFGVTGDRSKALTDQLRLTESTFKKLIDLGYQGSELQLLLSDIQTVSVKGIFAEIEAKGTAAAQKALRNGDTLQAQVEGVSARLKIVATGIDELFAAGLTGADAQVQYLQSRAQDLARELSKLTAEQDRLSRNAARRIDAQNERGDDTTPEPVLTNEQIKEQFAKNDERVISERETRLKAELEQERGLEAAREEIHQARAETEAELTRILKEQADKRLANATAAIRQEEALAETRRQLAADNLEVVLYLEQEAEKARQKEIDNAVAAIQQEIVLQEVREQLAKDNAEVEAYLTKVAEENKQKRIQAAQDAIRQEIALQEAKAQLARDNAEVEAYLAKLAADAKQNYESLLTDLAKQTDTPGLSSVNQELLELAKNSGVVLNPLDKLESEIDLLEKGSTRSKEDIDLLRKALAELRAEAERTQSLERFNATLEGITDTISTVGEGLGSLFDIDFGNGNSILEGLSSGLSSFLSLIPGVGGALSRMASTVGSVIGSILGDLSNGLKQVKKDVESLSKSYPLLGDAIIEGLKVTDRVSRGGLAGIFGFKKDVLNKEATQAGYDFANLFATSYADAIRNGFDGFGLDIGKIIADELLTAYLNSEEITQKILELTTFTQDALADGFIDASEQREIDRRKNELTDLGQAKRQQLIDAGLIEDTTPKDGSVAKAEADLAEQKEAFRKAATQAERDAIQKDIDRLEDTIKTLQGAEADTGKKDAQLTFDLPPAIQFALATPLLEASNTMLEAARLIYQTFSDGVKTPEMPSYTQTYNVSAQYDVSTLAAEAGRSAYALQQSVALPSAPGSSSTSSAYQNALETHGNRLAEHSKAMNEHAAAMRQLSKDGINVQSQATVNVKSSSMTEVYR